MYALPEVDDFVDLPEHAVGFAGGLYFRTIKLPKGIIVGQHQHDHPHATLVIGHVRGWKNGAWMGDKRTGDAFDVARGEDHCFLALEDSYLSCVHDEASALSVQAKGG